jgi:hypothetical protein
MENQAGGHADAFSTADDGTLTKKCNKAEWLFYKDTLPQFPDLAPFTPGFVRVEGSADENPQVVMKNLLDGYDKPCIMDIKMGVTSADPNDSAEKQASMSAKDKGSTTVSLGVRVVGIKTWNAEKNDWVQHDKAWGKALTDDNFADGVKVYFQDEAQRKVVAPEFVKRLQEIEAYMKKQKDLMFISSSVLFVMDGAAGADPKCNLKMIDFAHCIPLNGEKNDEGYLTGLSNLIPILEALSGSK